MTDQKFLLIVESPAKISKIQSFLPNNFLVSASVGHIRDLDKKELSVDIENNFKPKYVPLKDKLSVIKNLKKQSNNRFVILAQDADREGESISESIKDIIKCNNYHRIIFNEITKTAVLNALKTPRDIDYNLVNAQQTRRILDRLVGYKISPLLNKVGELQTANNYLAAGRVQSVIVRIIVDHEEIINEFNNKEHNTHYECLGDFKINSLNTEQKLDIPLIHCTLYYKDKKMLIASYDESFKLIQILSKCVWSINKLDYKKTYRYPSAPFITSTLQQHASNKLGFSLKKTMQIAQRLYENGYITYMRTDSTILSNEAHNQIKSYIISNFSDQYYQYKQYASNSKNAQEAHEAIRPTNINILELSNMDTNSNKLYKLIWKKTISSQMSRAVFNVVHIYLQPQNNNTILSYLMYGTLSNIIFDGFLKVYNDNDDEELSTQFIQIEEKSRVTVVSIKCKEIIQHPPTRYNEASLVKKLEQLGIGRPSTFASLLSKIQEHKYIIIGNTNGIEKQLKEVIFNKKQEKIDEKITNITIGKEKNKFIPTELGIKTTKFMLDNFSEIMDYNFTAKMENDLDEISKGNLVWHAVLKDFNNVLDKQINNYTNNNTLVKTIPITNPHTLIGTHPVTSEKIYYLKTKYGYAIKMLQNNKDIFVSVSKQPSLEEAITLFNNKKENSLIKEIGKYQIKNGKYGPYIQVKVGKGVKFFNIGKLDPKQLTLKDCENICKSKKV